MDGPVAEEFLDPLLVSSPNCFRGVLHIDARLDEPRNRLSEGHRLGSVDEAKKLGRVKDVKLTKEINRRVEIWTLKEEVEGADDDESLRDKPLFSGEVVAVDLELSDAESKVLVARIPPYHFGKVHIGQIQWNYLDSTWFPVHIDLEFNPVVDAQIVDNMVDEDDERNDAGYPIWIDVESTRSSTAIDNYHGTPEKWTLSKIVRTLSRRNHDEKFLKNPEQDQIDAIIRDEPPEVKNIVLERGHRMGTYLQAVLQRLGYNFKLEREDDNDGGLDQRIVLYKIGDGTTKQLRLQKFDEELDAAKSNVDRVGVGFDIGQLANKLYLYGARRERELTIPLYRGWPTDEDSSVGKAAQARAGRLWIGNEGGDYKELRDEIGDPPDLFGNFTTPRKRVLDNCLSLVEGYRRPPVLHYSLDGGDNWKNLDVSENAINGLSVGWSQLPNEIGVFLTDVDLPEELLEIDDAQLQMRITGTVRDDVRINYGTELATDSPNANTIERLIDVSDQFFDRARETTGDFASVLSGDADGRDDQTELEEYGDQLLKQDSAAHVQSVNNIPGISTEYEIGDIIDKVEGREISFNRFSDTAEEETFIQIVGIEYEINEGAMTTTLVTEAYNV